MQPAGDPTSVIGRRIGAYIIDTLIVVLIFFGAFFALASDGEDFDSDAQERAVDTFGFTDFNEGVNFKWNPGNQIGGYVYISDDDATVKLVEGTEFWIVTALGVGASLLLLVVM